MAMRGRAHISPPIDTDRNIESNQEHHNNEPEGRGVPLTETNEQPHRYQAIAAGAYVSPPRFVPDLPRLTRKEDRNIENNEEQHSEPEGQGESLTETNEQPHRYQDIKSAHVSPPRFVPDLPRLNNEPEADHGAPQRATNDEQSQAKWQLFLEQILQQLPPSSAQCCIYKIPEKLRKVSVESYTPRVVSIGLYHLNQPHLEGMSEHKLRYMDAFIRRNGISLAYYAENVMAWEQDIRDCYASNVDLRELTSDELVWTILMDGIFIVELLIKYRFPQHIDENDRIFHKPKMIDDILHDLILLENQLPFFVLDWFFYQVRGRYGQGDLSIVQLIHHLLKHLVRVEECPYDSILGNGVTNIVDFARRYYLPKSKSADQRVQINDDSINNMIPPSVTELDEAGVKFTKSTSATSLLDVKFLNGYLEIPRFEVDDWTETLIRNLMAYEQCHDTDKYITQYIFLMDCLINTTNDVDLLAKKGIISCVLGNSDDVSKLFNGLCKEISLGQTSYYYELCKSLKDYCNTPWHKWKATLNRDYFKNPWSVASTVAAVTILVFTLIQAVCSILQVLPSKPNK